MKNHLPSDAKIGSLFDGIGGFPLTFSEIYGLDSVVWASEVEPFPIAVTNYWFGNEDIGIVGKLASFGDLT